MLKEFIHVNDKARGRLRVLYRIVFVLLLAHFMLVYLTPGYFQPTHPKRSSWFGGRPLQRGMPQAEPRVTEADGRLHLRAGSGSDDYFDITVFRLDPAGLRYGIGREAFPALIEPEFASADEAASWIGPNDRVLAVKIDDDVHVYPIDLLIRHEVVNDVVAGVPIFAAYCILADLGAVYDRRLGEEALTFALSGYTYADREVWGGRDAFVLWDRETESLWWPLVGRAVSGPLIDMPLKLLDEQHWSQTTWVQIRARFPQARVLRPGQDFERPTQWRRLEASEVTGSETTATDIAPPWGHNRPW